MFFSAFSPITATHNYTCSVFVSIHTKIYKSQTRKSIETNSVSLSSVPFFSTLFCPVQCCCIFVLCKNKTELISMDFHPRFVGLWKNIHKYTTGIDVFFVESQRNKCMQLKKWMLYHGRRIFVHQNTHSSLCRKLALKIGSFFIFKRLLFVSNNAEKLLKKLVRLLKCKKFKWLFYFQ